jgi:hypothetical protein
VERSTIRLGIDSNAGYALGLPVNAVAVMCGVFVLINDRIACSF